MEDVDMKTKETMDTEEKTSNENKWADYENVHSSQKGNENIYPQRTIDMSHLENLYHSNAVHGLAGSQNLGNTCFMNSSIQCLSNSIDLTAYFLSKEYEKDINRTNSNGLGGRLADAWYELLYQLWEGRDRSVHAGNFKKIIGSKARMFSGFSQHDSHEFMSFFLDYINEDLNKISKKEYIELNEQGKDEDDISAAKRFWETHINRNDSIITDLFTGQFKSTIQCPKCEYINKTYDPFSTLSLPIPTLESQDIYFLSKYGMRKTIKMTIPIYKNAFFGDLSHIIKNSHSIESDFEKQRYMIVKDKKMLRLALPKDKVCMTSQRDRYLFCCDTDSKLQGNVTHLPLFLSVNNEMSAHPRLLSITKTMKYTELKRLVYFYTRKFLVLPIKTDEYDKEFVTLSEQYTKSSDDLIKICEKEYDTLFNNTIEQTEEIKEFLANLPYQFYLKKDNKIKIILSSKQKHSSDTEILTIQDDNQTIGSLYDLIKDNWNFHIEMDQNSQYIKPTASNDFNTCKTVRVQLTEKSVNLFDCFEAFQLNEQLEKNNEWYCKHCKEHVLGHKKLEIFYAPKLLIIHLKRFSSSRYYSDKIDSLIDFPINDFDMSPYIVGGFDFKKKYDLYAVSQHYGGCGGGHYTAVCKNNGQWYSFNDSSCHQTDERSIISSAAYVLFYRRKD